jgi:hypothetical protein
MSLPRPPLPRTHRARRPRRVVSLSQYLRLLALMVVPIPFCLYVATREEWYYRWDLRYLAIACLCYAFLVAFVVGWPMSQKIFQAANDQMWSPKRLIASWTYDDNDFMRVVRGLRKRHPFTWRFRAGYRKRPNYKGPIQVKVYWECIRLGNKTIYWSKRFPPYRYQIEPRLEAVVQLFDLCALKFYHSRTDDGTEKHRSDYCVLVPYPETARDEVRKVIKYLEKGYSYNVPLIGLLPS